MATEFERIKQAVDAEKNKKLRGEARITSLNEEEERIFENITKLTDRSAPITSIEEVNTISETMKSDIESKIMQMKQILDSEGVAY